MHSLSLCCCLRPEILLAVFCCLQTLIEQHDRNFRYKLRKDNSLGDVFGKFEDNKGELGIQEYGVSETTLEQIFVSRIRPALVRARARSFALYPTVLKGSDPLQPARRTNSLRSKRRRPAR